MYTLVIKRLIDLIISIIILPIFILVLLLVGPLIWLEDRGPVFYLGKRRGLKGKVFHMYKFRSMKVDSEDIRNPDNTTYNSPKDPRLTKVGRVIRATSIDELPQILNIIKGEMSWVGPRAAIPKDDYTWNDLNAKQQKRLTVRPGITGYTAVLYRNSIKPEEKLTHDCYYVDNISLCLDAKIFLLTIPSVLKKRDVYRN